MRKKLVPLMVVWGIEANAQNISGIVMDEKSKPIAFASITLMQVNDSSFVAVDTTDMDGRVKILTEHRSIRISMPFIIGLTLHCPWWYPLK